MGSKPQILAEFKQGKLLGTVEHFVDTMNWLVPFVANLKGEEGIAIKNPSTDHPLLELNIVAGEGIKITKSNGQMKISAIKEGKKEDDKPTTKKSGGNGSGSGGGGGGGGGSGGGGGGSGGGETNCNQWSDDIENDWGGGTPSNEGDSCTEINKW